MPSDDHPFDALDRQLELEASSISPVTKYLLSFLSRLPPLFWPFEKVVALLREAVSADSRERLKIMLETCMNQVRKCEDDILKVKQTLSAEESKRRGNVSKNLLVDAARKAVNTRSIERVKRIGIILANGVTEPKQPDADEIEEMMRVAMDLGEDDVRYLRELVRIEGQQVRGNGRITRHSAHSMWENGFWGTRPDSELDSVFGKLESYGLVSHLAPPNNLNIMADIQNRYALLMKGVRFIDLIQEAK
jgi:hypothetical protein